MSFSPILTLPGWSVQQTHPSNLLIAGPYPARLNSYNLYSPQAFSSLPHLQFPAPKVPDKPFTGSQLGYYFPPWSEASFRHAIQNRDNMMNQVLFKERPTSIGLPNSHRRVNNHQGTLSLAPSRTTRAERGGGRKGSGGSDADLCAIVRFIRALN